MTLANAAAVLESGKTTPEDKKAAAETFVDAQAQNKTQLILDHSQQISDLNYDFGGF